MGFTAPGKRGPQEQTILDAQILNSVLSQSDLKWEYFSTFFPRCADFQRILKSKSYCELHLKLILQYLIVKKKRKKIKSGTSLGKQNAKNEILKRSLLMNINGIKWEIFTFTIYCCVNQVCGDRFLASIHKYRFFKSMELH